MSHYCIGIDTGGTYTDAVLMDTQTGTIVQWSKKPTTHHDLSIGVGAVLTDLFQGSITPQSVSRLSVSTTLATNAIVEGQGARVCLFVFGYVRHFKLPVVANIFLKGGHTITGEEDEPLDLEGLIDTLQGLQNEVDSYAVCGAMSIKNPTHELVAEKAISLIDPKPVFCSHHVSDHPGILERSATASLHAKLQPLMNTFRKSIEKSMEQVGLTCPVTIVCGNGKGERLDKIVDHAATTMASGPAATARFGSTAGIPEALVVDVGGTTTDICMIENGKPLLNKEGCRIGEWQTHVQAVDMYTASGGGDILISCMDQHVGLSKIRVQPLCMSAGIPDPATWIDTRVNTYFVQPTQNIANQEEDPVLVFLRKNNGATPTQIATATKVSGITLEKHLERLAFLQQITLVGFTPTDALHVCGALSIGDQELSIQAANALGQSLSMEGSSFAQAVLQETENTIERVILEYLSRRVFRDQPISHLLNGLDNSYFSVTISLNIPLIGIGAAARYFLPGVAKKLKTTVSFPDNFAVGNAIGAAMIGTEEQCDQ